MYKTMDLHVQSVSPIMLHNGDLANPANPFVKEMKPLQAKRKKTDDDFAQLAKLEFLGSLYTENNVVVIPSDIIYSTLINAAKKQRKGVECKSGLFCTGNFPLIYDGPKDPLALFNAGSFTDTRRVVIGKNSIMRTRPRFDNWELKFKITFDPGILNESQVLQFVEDAGALVGFCDYRPRFGRFSMAS